MKLWLKITFGVTALTLLVLGACLYYFSSSQATYTLSSMEESELKMLDLFCINLSAIEKLSSIDTNRETVINSAVHYAFMAQARLLHSETVSYGLKTEDTLYSHNCPYDLKDLLQLDDNQTRAWTTRVINGTYVFVACTRMTLFNHDYSIYLARDATFVFERIDALRRTALLLLITGMLLLTALLPMIVKRALHPLKELSETAQQIALGNYSLRAHIDDYSVTSRNLLLFLFNIMPANNQKARRKVEKNKSTSGKARSFAATNIFLTLMAPILNPNHIFERKNPRTGILSIPYFLRNSDGNASTPFRFRESSLYFGVDKVFI